MINVVQNVLDSRLPLNSDEGPHRGNAKHTALRRDFRMASSVLQRVLLSTSARQLEWVTRTGFDECSTVSKSRSIRAVRHVHGHAKFIHARDDVRPVFAQTAARIHRSSAQLVVVVHQLRDSLTQVVEEIDIRNRTEMLGVLQAKNDADLTELLRALDVVGSLDVNELIGVRGEEQIPIRMILERGSVDVAHDKTDGRMKRP